MESGKRLTRTVGIAKALTYFLHDFNWESFFEILGYKVVLSSSSTRKTFKMGFQYATNDQCLPIKVFLGHIVELKKKNVDYIFIPQIVSIRKKTYGCPQVLGAPLIAQILQCENMPPILSIGIDYNYRFLTILNATKLIVKLSKNPVRIFKAVKYFVNFISIKKVKKPEHIMQSEQSKKIGIIARKYVLKDEFLNIRIEPRIRDKFGYEVITSSQIHFRKNNDKIFGCRPVHWYEGQDLINAANEFMFDNNIVGIIFINYFGCGIDAFIEEIFKKKISQVKPYLCLSLDEHSAEAGIITRLEAFIDMINRKVTQNGT